MSRFISFASVISEIQQSDVFMTVKARIFETPAANLNGARVTSAFLDEIVANEKRYVGLPLYADVKALTSGKYTRLGHLYDERTGEFHSTQIGSFYKFEKEEFENGAYLIGYARIPKRNKKLSRAIAELFSESALKFSFEIAVGEYEELDDDTILIDASENNYLEGTAIVTFPACEDAVALELVAQRADDTQGGEKEMADIETKEVAEEKIEEAETTEEVENAETVKEAETIEEAACNNDEKKEKAEVIVTENSYESTTVSAFDTESGQEVSQTVSVETRARSVQEGTLVEAADGIHVAEADGEESDSDPSDSDPSDSDPEPDPEDIPVVEDTKKKTAEELIAELVETVASLKEEIASLKEEKKITAEHHTAEINPFMGDLNSLGKYSLLEKVKPNDSYSLLEKA